MGFCLSCCQRRKEKDVEREPLLRSRSSDAIPQARTGLEHIADVLAALHAGKLPTQDQLNASLRRLLYSDLLRADKRLGGDVLNAEGKKVVEDLRQVGETLLQIGIEKNDDNRIQDLIYFTRQLSSVPVQVEAPLQVQVDNAATSELAVAARAIPTQDELANDTAALINSFRSIASLLLTSSAFRLILSDVLRTAREIVADTVERVRETAVMVEGVAAAVEDTVRPGVNQTDANEPSDDSPHPPEVVGPAQTQNEEPKDLKEVVLERVEDIIRQAQASPSYNSALRTIFYLIRKYAARTRIASAALSQAASTAQTSNPIEISAPVIAPDPQFARVLDDAKVILERFAGGRKIDPVLSLLSDTVNDIASAPASDSANDDPALLSAEDYFNRVAIWLDTALTDPQFVQSRPGRTSASHLYDEGHKLLTQNGKVQDDVRGLVNEVQAFVEALQGDRSTVRLVGSLDTLRADLKSFFGTIARRSRDAALHWRLTLLKVTLGWILPRMLSTIKTIPMPRIEYLQKDGKGQQFAVALDALLFNAAEELVPDVLSVKEWGEVRIELDEDLGGAGFGNVNAKVLQAKAKVNAGDSSTEHLLPISQQDDSTATEPESSKSPTEFERLHGPGRRSRVVTSSRIHIHIEGLRLYAHDLGYYAQYNLNSWLGYEDEGLMSVDIGRRGRRGEGLGLDIELEVDTDTDFSAPESGAAAIDSREEPDRRLFRVIDVSSSLPGLALHISNSKHWILNSVLLTPLAGPIGRAVGTRILAAQVKGALEKAEEALRDVKESADKKARRRALSRKGEDKSEEDQESQVSDWWEALLERFGAGKEAQEDEEEEGEEIYTESHMNATLKGVVYETYTQPEPPAVGPDAPGSATEVAAQPPAESTFAVGLGAQILPGKAEPVIERESPTEAARDVASAMQDAATEARDTGKHAEERTKQAVGEGIQKAAEVRREIEGAEERLERRERVERRRRGWRSRAFDL